MLQYILSIYTILLLKFKLYVICCFELGGLNLAKLIHTLCTGIHYVPTGIYYVMSRSANINKNIYFVDQNFVQI